MTTAIERIRAHAYRDGNWDYLDAYNIAEQLHRGQVRWYTDEPYFEHVKRVAQSVARSPEYHAADDDTKDVMLKAAILHDAVEDTDLTHIDVLNWFGEDVAYVVTLLTHQEGVSYNTYMLDLMTDPIARVIKRADTCDNMATLPVDDEHSFRLWKKYAGNVALFGTLAMKHK